MAITTHDRAVAAPLVARAHAPAVAIPRYVHGLSLMLAAAAAASGTLTFGFGGELTGTAVMNGSARGTGLVLAALAVPVLVLASGSARRGSARAVFVWVGAAMYMAYNALLLVLGTPLNRFFLGYVMTLGLSIAVAISVAVTASPTTLARLCRPSMPTRGLAIYLWVIVAFNALAWLRRIVPATIDDPQQLLDGTGVTMIPTYLQDLALWLPLYTVAAAWLWRRLPWGYLLVGGALTMWALEGFTVAVDQWFGHRADPASTVASAAAVLPFAISGLLGVAVAWVFLRNVEENRNPRSDRQRQHSDVERQGQRDGRVDPR